jgi:xylulokinase
MPVVVPEPAEYVALGAARQAAWALSGAAEPPAWPVAGETLAGGSNGSDAGVRARYGEVRDGALTLLTALDPRSPALPVSQ